LGLVIAALLVREGWVSWLLLAEVALLVVVFWGQRRRLWFEVLLVVERAFWLRLLACSIEVQPSVCCLLV
jgi:hypothetical protein